MKKTTIAAAVFVAAALCAAVLLARAEPKRSAAEGTTVIGYLRTRCHEIALLAGGRYTIATRDGRVVAANVTRPQLQARLPALHRLLVRSLAAHEPNSSAALRSTWAGM